MLKMNKPIVVTWVILVLLGGYGVFHFWPLDRTAAILNLVLIAVSGLGLLREWRRERSLEQ